MSAPVSHMNYYNALKSIQKLNNSKLEEKNPFIVDVSIV